MEEKKTARAQLMYARIAPRKVQIVCELIKGKDTKYAEAILRSTPKAAIMDAASFIGRRVSVP